MFVGSECLDEIATMTKDVERKDLLERRVQRLCEEEDETEEDKVCGRHNVEIDSNDRSGQGHRFHHHHDVIIDERSFGTRSDQAHLRAHRGRERQRERAHADLFAVGCRRGMLMMQLPIATPKITTLERGTAVCGSMPSRSVKMAM